MEVPEEPRGILDALNEQAIPGEEEAELRLTVPVNPARPETVTTEVACPPALTVALLGLAVSAKSVTVKLMTEARTRPMLLPVTVTV